MPNIGELVALLRADISDLDKKLDKAKHHTKKTTKEMSKFLDDIPWKKMGVVAAAGFAVTAVAIGKAISVASDLQEVTSKFNTVFAGQQKSAEEFVEVLRGGYATSEREAKYFLSAMQDLLVPMGVANDAAADLSFEIVKLAADLGSFNNMPTERVMLDIQSALVGNYETMKKYGVVLNAASIEQKIFEMGLAKTKDEITAADKALAAHQMIVEGSTFAIGDMARTQEEFANQLKQAKAYVEDIVGVIGTALLPIASDLIAEFNEMAKAILEDDDSLQLIIETAQMAAKTFVFLAKVVMKIPAFFQAILDAVSDTSTEVGINTEALLRNNAANKAAFDISHSVTKAKRTEIDSWRLLAERTKEAQAASEENANEEKKISKERLKLIADFDEQYAALGKSKFELEREQIAEQAEKWEEAGAEKVQLAKWVASQLSVVSQAENELSLESLTEQMEAELGIKTVLYEELTLKDQIYYATKMTALETWYNLELKRIEGNEKAKQKVFEVYSKKKQSLQKAIDDEALADAKIREDGLNAIAQAGSMKGFGILKAAALPEIYTSTQTGAINAYKALASIPIIGPVLGAAAAAAVIIYGGQRAATVMGLSIAHEGLEFVPREYPYLLDRGERVLSSQQNIDFTDFMEAYSFDRSQPAQNIPPIRIVVEFEGEVLKEYIYEATKSGEPVVHERGITNL